MVSKLVKLNEPQGGAQIKNRSLADTLSGLRIVSQRLESLMSDTRHYRGVAGLDISHGPMAPGTAEEKVSIQLIKGYVGTLLVVLPKGWYLIKHS